MRSTERIKEVWTAGRQSVENCVLLSGVHHLRHVRHPLREEGRVLEVSGEVLHGDVAVHPGLLSTADRGHAGGGFPGWGVTALTSLSLTFSPRTLQGIVSNTWPRRTVLTLICLKLSEENLAEFSEESSWRERLLKFSKLKEYFLPKTSGFVSPEGISSRFSLNFWNDSPSLLFWTIFLFFVFFLSFKTSFSLLRSTFDFDRPGEGIRLNKLWRTRKCWPECVWEEPGDTKSFSNLTLRKDSSCKNYIDQRLLFRKNSHLRILILMIFVLVCTLWGWCRTSDWCVRLACCPLHYCWVLYKLYTSLLRDIYWNKVFTILHIFLMKSKTDLRSDQWRRVEV